MAERLFTWVTQVRSARQVEAALAAEKDNLALLFGQLPMLHFASLTLFPPERGTNTSTLVFESNIDGPVREYVNELVALGRKTLDRIYAGLDRYPDRWAPNA